MTPRPRVNLLLYDGVLAPCAAWRAAVVPAALQDGGDSDRADSVQYAAELVSVLEAERE